MDSNQMLIEDFGLRWGKNSRSGMGLFSRYFHIILSKVKEPFAQNQSNGKISFRGEGTQAKDETLIYPEPDKTWQTVNTPVQVLGHPPRAGEI